MLAPQAEHEAELTARLRSWGLRPAPTHPLTPHGSKNRTMVCITETDPAPAALVKIGVALGDRGVLREGAVLQRLEPLRETSTTWLQLPRLRGFDGELAMLALEWVADAQTLFQYHRGTGRYEESLAERLGRAIAELHRRTHAAPAQFRVEDGFRERSDLLESVLRMRPAFYARQPRASIDLLSQIQRDAGAVLGLQALSDSLHDVSVGCVLHGDLKQANILITAVSGAPLFIDWELSFWGDPARDLGALLADYVLGWLAPRHASEVLAEETLRHFCHALLEAYTAEREPTFPVASDLAARVVRWCGMTLLGVAYGETYRQRMFDEPMRAISAHAQHMLAEPGAWQERLVGAP